jgi:hypothetical protein
VGRWGNLGMRAGTRARRRSRAVVARPVGEEEEGADRWGRAGGVTEKEGMTAKRTGMTEKRTGMTKKRTGMTEKRTGMTESRTND